MVLCDLHAGVARQQHGAAHADHLARELEAELQIAQALRCEGRWVVGGARRTGRAATAGAPSGPASLSAAATITESRSARRAASRAGAQPIATNAPGAATSSSAAAAASADARKKTSPARASRSIVACARVPSTSTSTERQSSSGRTPGAAIASVHETFATRSPPRLPLLVCLQQCRCGVHAALPAATAERDEAA